MATCHHNAGVHQTQVRIHYRKLEPRAMAHMGRLLGQFCVSSLLVSIGQLPLVRFVAEVNPV
ncbi:hypothetical protein E2C01_021976 [Portunus trituberculatus]|uniref:Uncharacterized protein n=1 Tax=Portunus trituberculatus TaxID=210409 RepID=A0A5B7E616_PORTR|nr:hypothetical protein [Portunus trituberculatus]